MTRPHPVVRIPTELTDGRWGSTHQSHIGVDLIHEEEVLVGMIESFHAGANTLFRVVDGLCQDTGVSLYYRVALSVGHGRHIALQYPFGYILHALQETYGQPWVGKLLVAAHCPEAITQVVVLHCTVLLNLSVATVVVRKEQSVGRYHLTGASTAEAHHRIFQRSLVHTIYILGSKPETLVLHILYSAGNEQGQPHTLIGLHRHQCRKQHKEGQK